MGLDPIIGAEYAGTLFAAPPAQVHSETSAEAAESVLGNVDGWRRIVYDAIAEAGAAGATDNELQETLGMHPNTEVARRVELWRAGLVRPSGQYRQTLSGRRAIVWVPGSDPDAGQTAAERRRARIRRLISVVRRAEEWLESAYAARHADPAAPAALDDLCFILRGATSAMFSEALAAPAERRRGPAPRETDGGE